MQDIRIRTGTAMLLSVIAFLSLSGAVAAGVWWLVFANKTALLKSRLLLPSILMVGFFSLVLELTGGGGISYFIRMGMVILIGAWLLCEQQQGEFLGLGVWLFGPRAGFEIGMVAEMGVDSLDALKTDFQRIRVALQVKGIPWGFGSILPAGRVLIHRALIRADETAEILAMRGYTRGGSFRPVFSTTGGDILAGFCAILVSIIVLLPVSEFFILSH